MATNNTTQNETGGGANIRRWITIAVVLLILAVLAWMAATSAALKSSVKNTVFPNQSFAVEDRMTLDSGRYVLVSNWEADPERGKVLLYRCNAIGVGCDPFFVSHEISLRGKFHLVEVNGEAAVLRGTTIIARPESE